MHQEMLVFVQQSRRDRNRSLLDFTIKNYLDRQSRPLTKIRSGNYSTHATPDHLISLKITVHIDP